MHNQSRICAHRTPFVLYAKPCEPRPTLSPLLAATFEVEQEQEREGRAARRERREAQSSHTQIAWMAVLRTLFRLPKRLQSHPFYAKGGRHGTTASLLLTDLATEHLHALQYSLVAHGCEEGCPWTKRGWRLTFPCQRDRIAATDLQGGTQARQYLYEGM